MSARGESHSNAVTVRPAIPEDLIGLARVHVDTWKTTYRGIVLDACLDALTYEGDVARGFGRWLKQPADRWTYLVALDPSEFIVGFAVGGPGRDRDSDYGGELGAVYVLKSYQRAGVGKALVREVTRHLAQLGITSMIVWVLEANPYRRFYEKLGGIAAKRRVVPVTGTPLPEVGYGWKDTRELSR